MHAYSAQQIIFDEKKFFLQERKRIQSGRTA